VYDASDSCSAVSNSIEVTVFDPPEKPVITRSGDVLRTAAGFRVQWYFGNDVIPGAVDTAYTATRTGSYKVRITDTRGCSTVSDNFHVGTLSAGEAETPPTPSVIIHPNPAHDRLYATVRDMPGRVAFRLYDALGRQVAAHDLHATHAPATAVMDIGSLPRGYYLLCIAHVSGMEWRSVVIY
jgi:hypothetical protein